MTGWSQLFQGNYEKGVRNLEEADKIKAKITRGLNEPNASLEMAGMYRRVESMSHQTYYYWRAIERIRQAEDGLFDLRGTIPHASILREKARIARESGLLDEDPDALESEANRIEEDFYAREKADRARHELPRPYGSSGK